MVKILLILHIALITSACSHSPQINCSSIRLPSSAAPSCSSLLLKKTSSKSLNVDIDPLKQLRLWEQVSNTKRWEKPTAEVQLEYVLIPKSELKIDSIDLPDPLKNILFDEEGEYIKWYRHPLNTSTFVPYLEDNPDGKLPAYYSASRSMFVNLENSYFTFKLATNNPHPAAESDYGKVDLKNDSIISMRRSRHIKETNKKSRIKPETLIVLTELASIASKEKKNGFSIRDLRPLQDGHYYLPAFSIPYVGKKIAKIHGKPFNKFWGKFYAKNLGIAKAELLLMYGMQMKTPNAQNWLIQLNKDLLPTGKIVMRDVADSNYINSMAQSSIIKKFLDEDIESRFTVLQSLKPEYWNSVWQMDEGGVEESTLSKWETKHEKGYINTVKKLLNIKDNFDSFYELDIFLKSEEGQNLILEFHENNNTACIINLINYAFKVNRKNFI